MELKSDVCIQCELLLDGLHGRTNEFDIADSKMRRRLVRRFYYLLMLELVLVLPCMEILRIFPMSYSGLYVRGGVVVVLLITYTLLYKWPNWRRSPPYNYLVFLLTSLTSPFSKSIYLMHLSQSRWLYAYPVILITKLTVLAIFSKQHRIKFTHGIGVIIIFIVFGLFLLLAYLADMFYRLLAIAACTLEAWYIIYDTHLMLSGRHGYYVGPREYMFAASNIHADMPKFMWILVKNIVFGPFIMLMKLVRNCRTAEIC